MSNRGDNNWYHQVKVSKRHTTAEGSRTVRVADIDLDEAQISCDDEYGNQYQNRSQKRNVSITQKKKRDRALTITNATARASIDRGSVLDCPSVATTRVQMSASDWKPGDGSRNREDEPAHHWRVTCHGGMSRDESPLCALFPGRPTVGYHDYGHTHTRIDHPPEPHHPCATTPLIP
mmetsp:Transcript_36633/g.42573  ORF Transcript_36633/g.42573 Transcript_36633/m.42573 type:complete len:177 (-) Transcript_36633:119-649(-)